MAAKKNTVSSTKKEAPVEIKDPNTLPGFITSLSKNIGFSLSGNSTSSGKKEGYNPFSVNNSRDVVELYEVMKGLREKNSDKNIAVPTSVSATASGKKVKFEFAKEIKQKSFDEIVEAKGLTNISLDDSNKKIEISK
ncbi:MAG: hypothetical protein IJ772_04515 [Bacilli bacterium]|nr:hypothetical protein [Bacilli bacterium]